MTQPDTGLPETGGQRQWLHHLRACEAEGQTMIAYANAHGLKVSALYSARKTLMEIGRAAAPGGTPFPACTGAIPADADTGAGAVAGTGASAQWRAVGLCPGTLRW